MRRPPPFLTLILATSALAASACGGSSDTKTVTVTKTVTKPAKSRHKSGSTVGTPTSTGAKNLVATPAVKTRLLAAGAALHKLPVSDYTGLTKGDTYYAYDAGTKTYWAGTQLIASSSSQKAQIGNQDDGAYLVFRKSGAAPWKGWETGAADTAASCQVKVPAAVIAVWGWAAAACHPRSF